MPPAAARTRTTEPATMACRLALARLAWRSRSSRSRSRAADFEAWLFRLLMLVFSMWDAQMSCAEYVWGTGRAQWGRPATGGGRSDQGDRARRSTPSQGVHEEPVADGGHGRAGAPGAPDRGGRPYG